MRRNPLFRLRFALFVSVALSTLWICQALRAFDGEIAVNSQQQKDKDHVRVLITVDSIRTFDHPDHRLKWMAECTAHADTPCKSKRLRIFMHSPVLKFGIAADDLAGRRFNIVVRKTIGEDVVDFAVENEAGGNER